MTSGNENSTSFQSKFYALRDDNHFTNQPNRPIRKEPSEIPTPGLLAQADFHTTVHDQNANSRATLIAATFRLIGFSSEWRLDKAQIEIRFQNEKTFQDPEVVDMWPFGNWAWSTAEETAKEAATKAVNNSPGPVDTCRTAAWARVPRSHPKKDRTQVVGWKRNARNAYGLRDSVQLTLYQNGPGEPELVTEFQTAVLLNRKDDERFLAHVSIHGKAGFKYVSTSLTSDPIIFDPKTPPVESPKAILVDTDNLRTAFRRLSEILATTDPTTLKEVPEDKTPPVNTRVPTNPKEPPVGSSEVKTPKDPDNTAKPTVTLVKASPPNNIYTPEEPLVKNPEVETLKDPNDSAEATVALIKAPSTKNIHTSKGVTKNEDEWVVVDSD
ncbi:hypothetical protein O1611_g7178 [Lasiodiplodia mahajangana]|uniref:Uncharacterized protein n=1 Tax=Lasiodiplodia mahajangana TaxID=1108764 RepID=A0ACC2JGG2_9PEZI|nr:hypothetical protein O1611_g7178 [Lasiodiplodia mahajangana]